jgi:LacI family transcriptional regulator
VLGIEDIARELKVSPSLVSKVLNGRLGTTRVSAKTLAAIREHADVIGYRKHNSAAALATGRHNVIGVFIHRVGVAGSGIMEAMINGIADEAALCNQRLTLHFFGSTDAFLDHRKTLHPSVMDGVIIGGLNHAELADVFEEVQESGVPVVTLHDDPASEHIANIGCDQVEVGRLATAHLIEQGCRRIATARNTPHRFAGYKHALAAAGLPLLPELIVDVPNYEYASGVLAAEQLLQRGVSFDGFAAQSDQHALGAINTLIGRGLRVPQDVKVIGIDDSPFCPFNVVPLSSINQEEAQRGRHAVRTLLDTIAGRSTKPIEPVRPTLHARRSSLS